MREIVFTEEQKYYFFSRFEVFNEVLIDELNKLGLHGLEVINMPGEKELRQMHEKMNDYNYRASVEFGYAKIQVFCKKQIQ